MLYTVLLRLPTFPATFRKAEDTPGQLEPPTMLASIMLASSAAAYQFTTLISHGAGHTVRSIYMTQGTPSGPFAGQTESSSIAAAAVAELNEGLPWFGLGDSTAASQGTLTASELEAIYYQYDGDSGGDIDKDELAEALFRVGYRIPKDTFNELFAKFDEDGGGTIDLQEFRAFIDSTGLKPEQSVKFAMDLFQKYDVDNGGTIDKFEFAELAAEVQANYQRRTFLTGVAAGVGALAVSKYSEEYAWAQKTFRSLYIERKAEAAQQKYFPGALLSSDLDSAIARTLNARGFTPQNTLFGHSVCSDEVNNKDEQLVDLMVSRWQEGFSLGGLGGLPFAGKSGFRAYLHHVPDSGKLLIMFAPHVGIDAEGRVGALQRDGQDAVSKACGAAVGSYKAIQAKAEKQRKEGLLPTSSIRDIPDYDNDPFDPELGIIIDLLTPRLKDLEKSEEPITFVTYQVRVCAPAAP